MSVIYFLIPIAIILVIIAVGIFFWAVRSDQFKDLERHGHSILFDDDIKHQSAMQGKVQTPEQKQKSQQRNAQQ